MLGAYLLGGKLTAPFVPQGERALHSNLRQGAFVLQSKRALDQTQGQEQQRVRFRDRSPVSNDPRASRAETVAAGS